MVTRLLCRLFHRPHWEREWSCLVPGLGYWRCEECGEVHSRA